MFVRVGEGLRVFDGEWVEGLGFLSGWSPL
jgi:hypothetical protein